MRRYTLNLTADELARVKEASESIQDYFREALDEYLEATEFEPAPVMVRQNFYVSEDTFERIADLSDLTGLPANHITLAALRRKLNP